MPTDEVKTLYIFIDESGDFTFSSKGSKYFILSAISTMSPLKDRGLILNARYEQLCGGNDIEYFHATEDLQATRNHFFAKIKQPADYEIDSVIAEKRKANFTLYEEFGVDSTYSGFRIKKNKVEEKFYKQICETLIQYIVYRYVRLRTRVGVNKIIVILDQVVTNRKREFVIKSIKTYIKNNFGIVPYVYFHATKADINSQIADYCCWAIKKKWDDKELRPYDEIRSKIMSEFDIFHNGTSYFY